MCYQVVTSRNNLLLIICGDIPLASKIRGR